MEDQDPTMKPEDATLPDMDEELGAPPPRFVMLTDEATPEFLSGKAGPIRKLEMSAEEARAHIDAWVAEHWTLAKGWAEADIARAQSAIAELKARFRI
jgi:hypothetical protein